MMPLPKTSSVSTIMRFLDKEGGRPRKQKIAIALSQARRHGAKTSSGHEEAKEAVRRSV